MVIETYWRVGKYISGKIETAQWGDGVVPELANYLQKVVPDPRGLSARNLWRMMQFHDFYRDYEKVSTVLAELYPGAKDLFRETYTLDFLTLPSEFREADLRKGIVASLKKFLIEFGRDFAFIGEEFRVQVCSPYARG